MPPITTGGFAELTRVEFREMFLETGKERALEHPLIFNVDEMEYNPQTDQQIAGLGTMPEKPEGAKFATDEPIIGGSKLWRAVPYGLAVEVTFEMWRDDNYGAISEIVKEIARAARVRSETVAFDVINYATATTDGAGRATTGFDGLALASTAHTRLDGGTNISNRHSADISFSLTGLMDGILAFENMVDERGIQRLLAPVLVFMRQDNKQKAREIMGSSGKPYTADNEINALVEEDLRYAILHYQTSTTAWGLMAQKGVHDLWVRFRDRAMFDGYDDPATKNAVFTAYQRLVSGFRTWRGFWYSAGA